MQGPRSVSPCAENFVLLLKASPVIQVDTMTVTGPHAQVIMHASYIKGNVIGMYSEWSKSILCHSRVSNGSCTTPGDSSEQEKSSRVDLRWNSQVKRFLSI